MDTLTENRMTGNQKLWGAASHELRAFSNQPAAISCQQSAFFGNRLNAIGNLAIWQFGNEQIFEFYNCFI